MNNIVKTRWITAKHWYVDSEFQTLEDAILTYRKLRKARLPNKKVISNLLYRIGNDSEWISTK
jgi:hypothetical protein